MGLPGICDGRAKFEDSGMIWANMVLYVIPIIQGFDDCVVNFKNLEKLTGQLTKCHPFGRLMRPPTERHAPHVVVANLERE